MTWKGLARLAGVAAVVSGIVATARAESPRRDAPVPLKLRVRTETSKDSKRFHTVTRAEAWDPHKTAVIVCDFWDLHHCLNAVRRVEEFGPRLNLFLKEARGRGMTIIHAPSDCMEAYKKHPARLAALAVPKAGDLPKDIGSWCSRIPAEERGQYPIDQSDGGEDDDPAEHRAWAEKLQKMGRDPRRPWKKESDLVTIAAGDFISDKGDEVWSILQQRGIDRVMLTGVHTNMCVLGRPFGLRQMVKNGKKAVLVRDLTDTMYNPQRWPYVSHFTGTDLIVEHIERFVCPTITSDQLLGATAARPFRFKNDKRPHLAMLIAENEYQTERTLPAFAARYLGKAFRVSTVFARDTDPNDLAGLEVLDEADLLLVSVRRRPLKPEQLAVVRRFAESKKPILGIRTASHAFSLLSGKLPRGLTAWPEFDKDVFGGNYHGHHSNSRPQDPKTSIRVADGAAKSPLLTGIATKEFTVFGTLYKTSPLAKGTQALLMGRVGDLQLHEPAAWTFTRRGGGRSFYTSLGHPSDFGLADFQRLLLNAIYWAADKPAPQDVRIEVGKNDSRSHWRRLSVPGTWVNGPRATAWYRCLIAVPTAWSDRDLTIIFPAVTGQADVFLNGQKIVADETNAGRYLVAAKHVEPGELNLLAVRLTGRNYFGFAEAPEARCGRQRIVLRGAWQFRIGDDPAWATYALPAKFAATTDVIFEIGKDKQ
jgi:nicotinamidase-related amidase